MGYDVVIIGAGPAGGQCGRVLAKRGKRVLLVEKANSFAENNFSSAGASMEIMDQFDLPDSIVATYWKRICMYSTHTLSVWRDKKPRGVVMDFSKLRQFLADEIEKHQGAVWLGTLYQGHKQENNKVIVKLKKRGKEEIQTVEARVLVDATGGERKVLMAKRYDRDRALLGTGIEYLMEVEPQIYEKYGDALSIFIGQKWMPQGYGWIFPMEPNRLKIGVGRYDIHDHFVPYDESFKHYLNQLIEETLGNTFSKVLDTHGKTLAYTYHRNDVHQDGRVVAIGDAVSTVNPLAFEGIRHAMVSGHYAADNIYDFLEEKTQNFDRYVQRTKNYCGWKWYIAEWLMRRIYREPNDFKMDQMVANFGKLTMDEMMELCFHYRWIEALKFAWSLFLMRFKSSNSSLMYT